MAMDLIVSDTGRVMIASTTPFAAEVVRVDFDVATRQISLAFAGDAMADQLLDMPVNARLTPGVAQAPRVLLVSLENGRIAHGYDVPLTCLGAL